jgi:mono/diheme cytochrome c family protein
MKARARWVSLAAAATILVAGGGALWRVLAAAPADHDLRSGRALYAQYCVSCHGDAGRGDGPSGAGLATKPADLTDGRLMNPLPDEFLVNIIERGGAAEGLAPTMPGFGAYLGPQQIRQLVVYVRSLARPAFKPEMAKPLVTVPGAPTQPIMFSHVIHAGSFQIACQYCHADARRSEYAGLPSVERCMGCHKIIGAADNPEIRKIHDYYQKRTPIPWVRVFKIPEFTYFPHKAHVRAGVECQTCHGPIERMRVVGATTGNTPKHDLLSLIGFRKNAPALTMGWCVDCHRDYNAKQKTKAPLDCVTCHH